MGVEFELETRRAVYDCITRFPGIHLREIQRKLDMPMGLLEFHLLYLERNRLVGVEHEEHYKRYYQSKSGIEKKNKKLLSMLRQDIPRRIMVNLLEQDHSSHSDILKHFDISPSTLSFHLKKLVKAKILDREKQGRVRYYTLLERDTVMETLITYQESFMDEVVDRFADVWLGIGID
jgi:predicted transcriptional regulator